MGELPQTAKKFLQSAKTKVLGWLCANLVPGNMTLISRTGIDRWYRRNGYFKFKVGDTIILKNRRYIGYGIRPVGTVIGYRGHELYGDQYVVSMTTDIGEYGIEWLKTGKVPPGIERKTETETENHFKWNIENQFRKIW